MSAPIPVRVLLVDDHAVVTEGLTMLLSRFADFEVVGTASGGMDAVCRVDELLPDVVLMDLSMPGVDGIEATQRIRAAHPDVRILALTAFLDQRLVADAVAAGVSGYLLKSVSGDELATAIRTIASGGAILTSGALPFLTVTSGGVGGDLTPRELDVVTLLADGLSNKGIATELGLTPGTVRIYVSNVLAKLHVENRTQAARLARDEGLVATNAERRPAQNTEIRSARPRV